MGALVCRLEGHPAASICPDSRDRLVSGQNPPTICQLGIPSTIPALVGMSLLLPAVLSWLPGVWLGLGISSLGRCFWLFPSPRAVPGAV